MPTDSPRVTVNRRAESRFAAGHPWIFQSDVTDHGGAQPGDAVEVVAERGKPLGMAHYSSSSQITLRMLTHTRRPIDQEFFRERLQAALDYRSRYLQNTDACRLVHAEADGLPALIVDRYADCLTVQTLNQGMDRAKPGLLTLLQELVSPRAIVVRNDAQVRQKENLSQEKFVAAGELDGPVPVRMNGLNWETDLLEGQKTGVFLDQRENYLAAARFARGRALDCFTCTGGFALHMAASCDHVEAVDSSAVALRQAARNRDLNGIENVEFREADVFDLLAGLERARKQFDTIVLDPPAFAKSRHNLESALRAYRDINRRALGLLAPGGILITCSCSFHVSEAHLLEAVGAAALDARRGLRVLERRTQALDHPVLLTVPETMYLKCLVFEAVTL